MRARLLSSLCLTLALAACSSSGGPYYGGVTALSGKTAVTTASSKLKTTAGGPALVAGSAIGPQGVVGGNLVSGDGGGLISGEGAAIVANNTGRYGLLSVKEVPITNAIVYLTDAQEHFYANGTQPITATTDAKGNYAFSTGLPTSEEIIVNVILSNNRREVGFTVSKAGKNVVNVSLATNYVTEFLRDRATRTGKAMADFDLSQLADLTRLTQNALDAGDLPVPGLSIGKIQDLNQTYALAVGLNKQGLGDAWAKMLGARVLALTTVAGSGESGYNGDGGPATKALLYKPKGVTRDSRGNLYIAEEGNDVIRKVAADGTTSTFAGVNNSLFSGDGGPATKAGLNWPRTVLMGPGDQLYVADTLNMRIRKISLADNTITTIAGNPTEAGGSWLNDFAGDGGPATEAKFAGVRGMAWDNEGRLVFSDTWDNAGGAWHHIRRINQDGTVETIVGVDNKHGYNGDGLPGRETEIDYVQQVAVDAQDNIFFADNRNNRVRKYDAKTGKVSTVAGDGTAGVNGDGGDATKAQLNSPYGVAVDTNGRVFISERGAKRLRVVTTDGVIHTIAGGGDYAGDGEARDVALVEPHDLVLEPDGNLLFCDARDARVRRLWLKWGF